MGRVLGAARAGFPCSSRARPLECPRRAASPARAAALELPRGRASAGRGRGRGGGYCTQGPSAAPVARSEGEDEAKRGRNHEPEFPQVSDPALLRLQRGGSQEQGEPGAGGLRPPPPRMNGHPEGDWEVRDGPAPTLERGAVRGMCRGPAILPAPARAQSPAAR